MKKIKTLKKNYEFSNVLKKGNVYYGNQIIVYINKNHKKNNVLGIAISTKLCKANKRNRLKRLIRENYRRINISLEQGYNIVFLWNKRTDIKQANYFKIEKDMISIFKKAKILKINKNEENNNLLFENV